MEQINYREEVLKMYPDAEWHRVSNGIIIISVQKAKATGNIVCGTAGHDEQDAWKQAYDNLNN